MMGNLTLRRPAKAPGVLIVSADGTKDSKVTGRTPTQPARAFRPPRFARNLVLLSVAVAVALLLAADTADAVDDGTIVFSRTKLVDGDERPPRVWIMNGDGSQERQLRPAVESYHPVWVAGGRRIAASKLLKPIFITVGRAGRDRQTFNLGLPHNPRTGSHSLGGDWSPDGRQIAFGYVRWHPPDEFDSRETYSTWIRPVAGPVRELTATADQGLTGPVFSPDGNTIAVRNARSLWLVNADGGGLRQLARPIYLDPFGGSSDLDWSPDGDRIAVAGPKDRQQRGTLQLVDVKTGVVRRLVDDTRPRSRYVRVVFSPDGKHIAYERRPGIRRAEIWIHDLRNGEKRKLITARKAGGGLSTFAWSPDSKRLAVACSSWTCARPHGIWTVSVKRKWTRLTKGRDDLGDWTAR